MNCIHNVQHLIVSILTAGGEGCLLKISVHFGNFFESFFQEKEKRKKKENGSITLVSGFSKEKKKEEKKKEEKKRRKEKSDIAAFSKENLDEY